MDRYHDEYYVSAINICIKNFLKRNFRKFRYKKCKVSYPIDKKIVNRFFFRDEQQVLTLGDTESGKDIQNILKKDYNPQPYQKQK